MSSIGSPGMQMDQPERDHGDADEGDHHQAEPAEQEADHAMKAWYASTMSSTAAL